MHLHEANSQLLFLNLKQGLMVSVSPVIRIHFLYICLAHVVYMLEVIEE